MIELTDHEKEFVRDLENLSVEDRLNKLHQGLSKVAGVSRDLHNLRKLHSSLDKELRTNEILLEMALIDFENAGFTHRGKVDD